MTTASASAGIVCVTGTNSSNATAVFYDNNTPQFEQSGCSAPLVASGTDETHQLSVTLGTGPNPSGGTRVNQVTFTDSNPIQQGDDTNPLNDSNICTINGNTAVCKARFYFFVLAGGNDTVSVTGAETQDGPGALGPQGCSPGPVDNPGGFFGDLPTMGGGNDTYNGSEGSDGVTGGDGDDTINGNGGSDALDGGAGSDTIHGNDGQDCISGGAGNDNETGDAGSDTLDCNNFVFGAESDGDDTLDGGDGSDTLCPGTGPRNDPNTFGPNGEVTSWTLVSDNDTLIGGPGLGDSVSYANRTDFRVPLTETENGAADDGAAAHPDYGLSFDNPNNAPRPDIPPEADNIGSDIENIAGGTGPNTMVGNDSDNTLSGGSSADNIQGLGGDDNISSGNCFSAGIGCGDDTMSGGDGRDTINGGGGNDNIDGGAGDDPYLDGGEGNDTVQGGAGNDFIDAGPGPDRNDDPTLQTDSDTLNGGDGEDTVEYFRSGSHPVQVTIDGQANDGEGATPNYQVENDNVGLDVEDVIGGAGDDSITGSAADNSLSGGNGNDTLVGGDGNDGLFGNAGNDTINGAGKGSTHLDGGDGNDTLVSDDNTRDENQCGAGTDSVQADGRDEIHGDCENTKVRPPAQANIGKVTVTKTGYVLVRVTCPASEPSCVGVVKIKSKKRIGKIVIKLAETSYRAAGGATAVVKALVPPKFRTVLKRAKRAALVVTVTNVNATTGLSSTTSKTATVVTKGLR